MNEDRRVAVEAPNSEAGCLKVVLKTDETGVAGDVDMVGTEGTDEMLAVSIDFTSWLLWRYLSFGTWTDLRSGSADAAIAIGRNV